MNVNSMTGYGKIDSVLDGMSISIEIRTVNNRFLEVSTKIPRDLYAFENQFKKQIQNRIARGSVFFNIYITGRSVTSEESIINPLALASYLKAAKQIEADMGIKNDLTLSNMLNLPDVIQGDKGQEFSEEQLEVIYKLVDQALDKLIETLDGDDE